MKTQRLNFKIAHGHAPACRTMYPSPDFNLLIPSFVLSYCLHALYVQSHHKDGPDSGQKEYLNVSKICQKGAYGDESGISPEISPIVLNLMII
jgi:hypothetical protein